MPPTYFHRNCNRYKEDSSTIWQSLSYRVLSFNTVTAISKAFSQAIKKSLHVTLLKICTSRCARCHCYLYWNAPFATSLCSYKLFGLHKHSESIDEYQWVPFLFFFNTWRNSMTQLCFIWTSMSNTILSDCLSSIIHHMATRHNGIQSGSFILYWYITNICFWQHGPT